ncbi:MAG: response regulator [Verrucomicrobiota bacterium]
MKILIVDDDPITRETMRSILSKEKSWELVDAGDGEIAWDMLKNGYQPDLCIIDLIMPRLDGMGLLEKMRADKRFANTRALMVTLTNDRSVVMRAIEFKVSGYLLKPFSAARVMGQVKKIEAALPKKSRASGSLGGEVLADPETVIKRLDITHKRYLQMLEILTRDLEMGVSDVERSLDEMDILGAISRIDAMKGGAATLGAHKFHTAAVSAKLDGAEDDISNLRRALEELNETRQEIAKRFEHQGLLKEEAMLNEDDVEHLAKAKRTFEILVVEDKTAIVDQISKNLASEAWRISGVPSTSKAMEKVMQSQPDLVMVSLSLPDQTAFSFFRFMRSNGKTQHVPAFGLSIKTNIQEQETAMERGFDAIITKPIDYKSLKTRFEKQFGLDTSARYYQIEHDYLKITLPARSDGNELGELENYLADKLADAINHGVDKVVFDLTALSAFNMDFVKFLVGATEKARNLSIQIFMVGTDALAKSSKEFEECQEWKLHASIQEIQQPAAAG